MPAHFLSVQQQIELMLDLEEKHSLSNVERLALDMLRHMSQARERQDRWQERHPGVHAKRQRNFARRKRKEAGVQERTQIQAERDRRLVAFLAVLRARAATDTPTGSLVLHGQNISSAKKAVKRKGFASPDEHKIWRLTEAGEKFLADHGV